jgi:acyl carrier protein
VPLDGWEVYILDARLHPVPQGVPGEMYVGGQGVARGYHQRAELTAERFIPHPFSEQPGARLYRTGDRARFLDDGDIEYLGRLDNQVKIRGFRIEPGEIEAALEMHEGVRQAIVITREDTPGEKRLVAYVVLSSEAQPPVEELREFLKERLPSYMVPAAFKIIEQVPLTPNGKLDYRALPSPEEQKTAETFVPPQTETEKKIAAAWQEILGVEKVSVHENFFDLGGHSFLMTEVVDRMRNVYGLEVPMADAFEHPTIFHLARHLTRGKSGQRTLPPKDDQGEKRKEGSDRLRQQFRQRQRTRKS